MVYVDLFGSSWGRHLADIRYNGRRVLAIPSELTGRSGSESAECGVSRSLPKSGTGDRNSSESAKIGLDNRLACAIMVSVETKKERV